MPPRSSLDWAPLSVVLATGLLSVGPIGTLAQTTTAACLSSFHSLDNSRGQTPCLVSAYLQGACNGGQFTVGALDNGTHYTGPSADQSNPCQCSSVTYNTISACGLCQNHSIISWSSWNLNCTTVYPGVFPPGVPDGTAVPQWAFQDVTASDIFNVTIAQAVGDTPESTASRPQSTGSIMATTISLSSDTPSATSSTFSGGSKSNTGAIAGGVVGGVVGVALIAGVLFFMMRRRRSSQIAPPARFSGGMSYGPPSTIYTDSTAFAHTQMVQPKLYDPLDPSTFPASPPPTTIMTGSSHDVPSSPQFSSASIRPGGGYNGMPEI